MKERRKPKVYFALLNHGKVRREFVGKQLPEMQATKNVDLVVEPFSLTWDSPIYSNRNKITKRFMKTDCDFLLMQDDDVVPLCNPLVFALADKDVIGIPAKVRQVGRAINWVTYVKHPDIEYYAPVDWSKVDSDTDLLKVDAVGTGCILIHRRALQHFIDPFTVKNNDEGICMLGTDFAFCQKAKKAGYEIWSTNPTFYCCEHFKEVGLNDITGYDDSDYRHPGAGKYKIPWGEWSISQKDWEFMERMLRGVKSVVEFGTGISSLLLSERVPVVSYETNKEWAAEVKAKKFDTNKLKIRHRDGKTIRKEWRGEKYDLCFVDAPIGQLNGGVGRQHSMQLAAQLADRVIVHDAGRQEEIMWQMEYLRKNGFKMVAKNGNHQARCQYWVRRTLLKF